MTTKTTELKIDPQAIGVEVSWSFGDGDAEAVTLPRDAVRAAFDAFWKADLIEDISADKALRKAMQLVKGRSKEIVIQEFRRPNKDTPRAVGVYQVQAKEGESGDRVVCGARVRIRNGQAVAMAPEGEPAILSCMTVAEEMARFANSLVANVVNRDISDALVSIGWAHGWITRRRNSGGVYFFPAGPAAERFITLLLTLKEMTATAPRAEQFVPQIMEVYPKPLTLSMWSESARDQYEAMVADMVTELKKMEADGTMRDSTMQKRADECDRLIAQAEQHRMFLQENVEAISSELKRVRDRFHQKMAEAKKDIEKTFEDFEAANPKRTRAVKKAEPKPEQVVAQVSDFLDVDDLFDV